MSHLMSHSWSSAIATTMILASAAVVLLAAWHDLVSRTVPNWMPGLDRRVRHRCSVGQWPSVHQHGIGLVIFIVAAICWRRGLMGGADVKLLGAIAIALPPGMVSLFVLAMSLAGAVHAVAYMVARRIGDAPSCSGVESRRDAAARSQFAAARVACRAMADQPRWTAAVCLRHRIRFPFCRL